MFLEHGTRRLHITGVTAHPTRELAVQQARNLAADLGLRMESLRFLLRDRDGKYGQCFDAVFEAEEMQIPKSAPQAPRMNAHCERVIGTIRREVLDHVLIVNEAHARQVLATYQWHYNEHRPIGPATNYLRAPTSSPSPYTSSKAADSCGPASSAASSTSTAIRLDLQRRLSEPHRAFAWVDDEVTRRDLDWVRGHHSGPAYPRWIHPGIGPTGEDFEALAVWAHGRGGATPGGKR